MKNLLVIIIVFLYSFAAMARKPAQDHKIISVRDAKSSIAIFHIDSNDCDNSVRVAKTESGMTRYQFIYRCSSFNNQLSLEILDGEKLIAAVTYHSQKPFHLTVPFQNSFISISSN